MKNRLEAKKVKRLYWDNGYNVKEVAKKLNTSIWVMYDFMQKNNIARRSYSEVNYLLSKNKPQFKIKKITNLFGEKLKIAGIMLYWAEGTLLGGTVDFANSNPRMIMIFLKFLREICGISDQRLRVYLYAYEQHDIQWLKSYWSDITKIPLAQFTKPYVRTENKNYSGRKLLYGLVHIRYNDKKLLKTIGTWIHEYIDQNCGEIPEWPNGSDCEERSVLKKFRMEKRVNSGEPLKK